MEILDTPNWPDLFYGLGTALLLILCIFVSVLLYGKELEAFLINYLKFPKKLLIVQNSRSSVWWIYGDDFEKEEWVYVKEGDCDEVKKAMKSSALREYAKEIAKTAVKYQDNAPKQCQCDGVVEKPVAVAVAVSVPSQFSVFSDPVPDLDPDPEPDPEPEPVFKPSQAP